MTYTASNITWTLGKSLHFSDLQFSSFMKWSESVRSLTSPSPPLGLSDIHQRWALVWLACLLFAAVLFLLLLLKKDHAKGESFPAPQSPGAGLEQGREFTERRQWLSSPSASAPLP